MTPTTTPTPPTTPTERAVAAVLLFIRNPRARVKADDLAAALNVSPRTAYRMLRVLHDSGLLRGGGSQGYRLTWRFSRGRTWS